MNPSNTHTQLHNPRGAALAKARPLTRSIAAALAVVAMIVPLGLPMTASAATAQKISASAWGEVISVSIPIELLTTEDGAARIYAALERKANTACKKTIPMRVGRTVNVKKCTAELMGDFIADLDNADMTARHAAAQ